MYLELKHARVLLHILYQSIQDAQNITGPASSSSSSSSSSTSKNTFACYLFLLLTGLRKAYLVDCYAPSYHQVLHILREVKHRCAQDLQLQEIDFSMQELVVIHMDNVVLLVEYEHWKEVALTTSPYVVDISNDLPILVNSQEMESLMDCIYSFAISNVSEGLYFVDVKVDEMLFSPLQLYPLLSGHYLGYPICYNFMSNATSTANALSMQPLRRLSYRVSIPELAPEQPLLGDIDLIEYTCPVIILENYAHVLKRVESSIIETKQTVNSSFQRNRLKDSFPAMTLNICDSIVTLHNPVI